MMPAVFFAGMLLIALEDTIKVNKAAIAISICATLWIMLLTHMQAVFQSGIPELVQVYAKAYPELISKIPKDEIASLYFGKSLQMSLGNVSSTLFFVLASMAIIEILDSHGAFSAITRAIRTRSKRALLWIISGITFILAAILGNLATVIIVVAVLRKLISDAGERLPYSCLAIIAANAGGCWSPIGDVTTLLLWTGGNIKAVTQIAHLILPAAVTIAIPCAILTFKYKKGEKITGTTMKDELNLPSFDTRLFQTILLCVGLLSFLLVPVLQASLELPPYMCVIFGLAILWIITDIRAAVSGDPRGAKIKVSQLFSHLDIATVLFFLGILMSVEAMKEANVLTGLATMMNNAIHEPNIIAMLLGGCSSVLDNVALVAAAMGMYPIAAAGPFMADSVFWIFLAYCAVTGGSILIIGSASGVTVMGLEKVSFTYYLKKFTPLALLAYLCGCGLYLLMC